MIISNNCSLDRVHILEDRSLTLENINLSDEGEYSCEVDNAVGSLVAVGSLTVYCRFSIFGYLKQNKKSFFFTFEYFFQQQRQNS